MTRWIMTLTALALALPAIAENNLDDQLRQVRSHQQTALSRIAYVLADRRSGAEDRQLLGDLETIHAIQQTLHDTLLGLGRELLGRDLDRMDQEQRGRLGSLAEDQHALAQRFAVWEQALRGRGDLAEQPTVARVLRLLAENTPGQRMEQTAQAARANRLAPAAREQQALLDELAMMLDMLTHALAGGDDATARNLALLKRIIEQENELLEQVLAAEEANSDAGPALARRQVEIRLPLESLTDWLGARVPHAAAATRGALSRMEFAANALERNRYDEAAPAIEEAIEMLELALERLEEAIEESQHDLEDDELAIPLPMQRRDSMRRAMQVMMAAGGSGRNPLSEILNDLNAIEDLAREQRDLRGNLRDVDEQEELGPRAGALAARVADYEYTGEAALRRAAEEMQRAAQAMRDAQGQAALAAQDTALAALEEAHAAVQAFWDELLEAMAALMMAEEGGPAMGGGDDSDPSRTMGERERRELIAMLRATIAMNTIRKTQIALSERVAAASNEERLENPETLATAQLNLSNQLWDLSWMEDLDPHLGNQLRGVWDFSMAAFIQARVSQWVSTHHHQQEVLRGLQIASSASADMVGRIAAQSGDQDLPELPSGSVAAALGGLFGGAEGAAWMVELPQRQRDRIQQALAEPFPAAYEPLIRAYYRRLAQQQR